MSEVIRSACNHAINNNDTVSIERDPKVAESVDNLIRPILSDMEDRQMHQIYYRALNQIMQAPNYQSQVYWSNIEANYLMLENQIHATFRDLFDTLEDDSQDFVKSAIETLSRKKDWLSIWNLFIDIAYWVQKTPYTISQVDDYQWKPIYQWLNELPTLKYK